MTDDQRRVRVTYDDLDELAGRVQPDNPKRHDMGAIAESVGRFGYVTPVVVNDADGRILEGHGRIEALLARRARGESPPPGVRLGRGGQWGVPVVHGVELSPDEARRFVVAANRTVELGGWDEQRLSTLLAELTESDDGLAGVGFSEADLTELIAGLDVKPDAGQSDPDDVPQEPDVEELYVKRGDLWSLGQHRLLCGDATSESDVARLMDGLAAEMCFTDPPYGVEYRGGSRPRERIAGDQNMAVAAKGLRQAAHALRAGGAAYCCHPSLYAAELGLAFRDAGLRLSAELIWVKDSSTSGRGRVDYRWQHEPLLYGWKPGARHRWHGGRQQTTVWEFPRPARSDEHPTVKPVALVERAIRNSSDAGAIVLDPFLGSGTTLIACERLRRRCFAIEIEPRFVQLAIERWQAFTGLSAVREAGT